MGILKQQYLAGNLFGFQQPAPPTHFVLRVVTDALQVIARNTRVHVMQFMGIHVQKYKGGKPGWKLKGPREDFLLGRSERIDCLAMT